MGFLTSVFPFVVYVVIAVIDARRYSPSMPLQMYPLLVGAEKGLQAMQIVSKTSSEGQLAELLTTEHWSKRPWSAAALQISAVSPASPGRTHSTLGCSACFEIRDCRVSSALSLNVSFNISCHSALFMTMASWYLLL